MNVCWLLLLSLAGFFPQEKPEPIPPTYSQSYSIFIRGSLAGTETVRETVDKDGNQVVTSDHDMIVNDGLEAKRLAYQTVTVFAKGTTTPLSYLYKYLTGESNDYCEVNIRDGNAHRVLSRSGNIIDSASVFKQGSIILDFNVFHQYDMISRVYDFKAKGRQFLTDYIPVIGQDIQLAVTWLEDAELETAQGKVPVRNFKIEFVGVRTGNFSTDAKGRLVRLLMREQDLEVVRTDLVPR